MDDLDDITRIAVAETKELLLECEQLLLKSPVDTEGLADLFQRVHTAKSNLAVVPGSRLLSHLLQNLETVLAQLRAEGTGIGTKFVEPILKLIQSASELLETDPKAMAPEMEMELCRSMNALRLECSRLKRKAA